MGLLLEFCLCALFYNLDPSEDEPPLFWEGVMQNFWVGVYSVVFSAAPLLLLGLCYSFPSKWKARLQQAGSLKEMKKTFRSLEKNIRYRSACGFIMFGVLSNFLLLFLICFCQVASD